MFENIPYDSLKARPLLPPRVVRQQRKSAILLKNPTPRDEASAARNLPLDSKHRSAEGCYKPPHFDSKSMIEISRATPNTGKNDRHSTSSLPEGYHHGCSCFNNDLSNFTCPKGCRNTMQILQRASSYPHEYSTPLSEHSTKFNPLERQSSGMFSDKSPAILTCGTRAMNTSSPYACVANNSTSRITTLPSQLLRSQDQANLHDAGKSIENGRSMESQTKPVDDIRITGKETRQGDYDGALQQQQYAGNWNDEGRGRHNAQLQKSPNINDYEVASRNSKSPPMSRHDCVSRITEVYPNEYGIALPNLNEGARSMQGQPLSYSTGNVNPIPVEYQGTAQQSTEENRKQADQLRGLNSLEIYENKGNIDHMIGNDDQRANGVYLATRTNSTCSTCSSTVSLNEETVINRRSSAQSTCFDLRIVEQNYGAVSALDDMRAFECEVDVWPYDPREYEAGPMAPYVTLLFDTQCQRSNWIAQNIVKELGVHPVRLTKDEEFVASNGQLMKAFFKITLWFGNSRVASSKRVECADFLVHPVEDVPFDMLLGASDCLRLNIIQRPRFFALAHRKLSPSEKKDMKERMAQHTRDMEERQRQISQWQSTKRESLSVEHKVWRKELPQCKEHKR